jgi:FixJ family two-component response regulator
MRPPTHFSLGEASETLMPKRQKILAIIEDDTSMLRAAGDLLNAHGFATLAFASAEEFLARGAKHVDCLLLDIDLGGMSGIELRRQLKGFGSTLPIIFMTGLDDEAIERRALETGCVAFSRKPFSQYALVEAIGKAVA